MQPQLSKISQVSGKRRYISTTILLLVVLAGVILYAERQPLHDWLVLRTYTPPGPITQLASDDTMTAKASHLFYINRPAIEDKNNFGNNCPGDTEKTIVLGCYVGDENGIYLLGVSDPRLKGVEQVTAAHEMLHAAYDRLSSAQRKKVDAMLTDYYQHDLTDQRIKTTMSDYQQSEPGQLVDEMHSVFGTEIASLPAPLEDYYKQYFANRQTVVAYAASYQKAFTSREQTLKQEEQQLSILDGEIKSQEADLKSRYADLQAQQATLNREKSGGDIQAYNAGVDSYNAGVEAYQRKLAAVKLLISQYNRLVAAHNALVFEERQLAGELQAPSSPTTTQ